MPRAARTAAAACAPFMPPRQDKIGDDEIGPEPIPVDQSKRRPPVRGGGGTVTLARERQLERLTQCRIIFDDEDGALPLRPTWFPPLAQVRHWPGPLAREWHLDTKGRAFRKPGAHSNWMAQ